MSGLITYDVTQKHWYHVQFRMRRRDKENDSWTNWENGSAKIHITGGVYEPHRDNAEIARLIRSYMMRKRVVTGLEVELGEIKSCEPYHIDEGFTG